ncbi:MAG: hypothetical protein N2115_04445, partial [bacterium]|nr:hypothetical protein [bacterium]
MDIFEKIYQYIESLEIVDTHEHLPTFEQKLEQPDVLKTYLTHYFVRDLISAGMKKDELKKITDTEIDIKKRWLIVEPYWNMARYTGYGRVLDIVCRDIYGLSEISDETIEELNKRFINLHSSSGIYDKILKKESKILFSIVPSNDDYDSRFFKIVGWLDHFVFPLNYNDIRYIECQTGIRITCFDDWLD